MREIEDGYFADEPLPDETGSALRPDASRVNINEEAEVEYWSKKLGVTPAQLRAAVAKVGDFVRRVETELRRR